jgi:uncharacterized protein (TIGR03435 family)
MDKSSVRRGAGRGLILVGCALFAAASAGGQAPAAQSAAPSASSSAPSASAPAAAAQGGSDQLPVFDVVSVKTHKDEGMMMRMGISATPDGFQADGIPLQMLIRQAFGVSEDRIFGEPDWAKSSRFDINAKVTPDDAPKLKALTMEQRSGMMLPVLEDRFGMKYHHETKELQVYSLVAAKGGPKLKESTPAESDGSASPAPMGSDGKWLNAAPPPTPPPAAGGGQGLTRPAGGSPGGNSRTMMRMSQQGMTLEAAGATMESLTRIISQQISATVVDKTGLKGKYDFALSFTPDNFQINGHPPDGGAESQEPVGPSIFTALPEQLGLKLEAQRQTVDVIVIDHIEQPTAN